MRISDPDSPLHEQPRVRRRISGAADISGERDRGLRLYVRGFGLHDVEIARQVCVEHADTAHGHARARAFIRQEVITLPPFAQVENSRQYDDASVAHAIGHLRYSAPGCPVGAKVPMMVAIQSLVEDARIERRMIREYPGLWALWNRFHRADGAPFDNGLTFAALARRLTLALHDPAYRDPHHWVNKGRSLFDALDPALHDASRFRDVASILANDLGQMRVRFDLQSYLVEPAYRDDNTFLWRFDEDEAFAAMVQVNGEQVQGVAEARANAGNGEIDGETEAVPQTAALLYPEWNYKAKVLRENWVSVVESRAARRTNGDVTQIPPRKQGAIRLRSRQVLSTHRLRRQPEGDELDVDALVNHVIAQRSRGEADGNVFVRPGRRPRAASVLVLLDLSASTSRQVDGSALSLIDCERAAAEEAIAAFDSDHSRVALHGFASNGRSEVRYLRVKDFGTPYGDEHREWLWTLRPAWSTRFGAALRHAGACLAAEDNPSKTIILVTDGEPSDIDVFDARYLVEDACNAVDMLSARGIRTQCISVDPQARPVIREIFGRQHCVSIERSTRLVDVLPDVLAPLVA